MIPTVTATCHRLASNQGPRPTVSNTKGGKNPKYWSSMMARLFVGALPSPVKGMLVDF